MSYPSMKKVRADECEVACQGREPRVCAWGPVGIGKWSKPRAGVEEGHVPQAPPESRIPLTLTLRSTRSPEGKGPGVRGFREFLNLEWGDSDPEYTLGFPLPSPLWERNRIRKKVSITETFSKTSSWRQELSWAGLLEHRGHLTQVRRLVPYSDSITYCLLELEQITWFLWAS